MFRGNVFSAYGIIGVAHQKLVYKLIIPFFLEARSLYRIVRRRRTNSSVYIVGQSSSLALLTVCAYLCLASNHQIIQSSCKASMETFLAVARRMLISLVPFFLVPVTAHVGHVLLL
jgi:hypothetical protein